MTKEQCFQDATATAGRYLSFAGQVVSASSISGLGPEARATLVAAVMTVAQREYERMVADYELNTGGLLPGTPLSP